MAGIQNDITATCWQLMGLTFALRWWHGSSWGLSRNAVFLFPASIYWTDQEPDTMHTSCTHPAQPGPTRFLLQVQTRTEAGRQSEEDAAVWTLGSAAVVNLCFQQQTVPDTDKVPACWDIDNVSKQTDFCDVVVCHVNKNVYLDIFFGDFDDNDNRPIIMGTMKKVLIEFSLKWKDLSKNNSKT